MDKRIIAHVLFLGVVLFLVLPAAHAEDASEWYLKGQNSAIVGNYEDAIKYYDNAIAVENKYAPAYTGKAIALNNLNRHNEAVATADAALSLKKDPDAIHARADALFALGRYEESIEAYDLFFTFLINIPDAYCNQGKAYVRINEPEKAVAAFDRCTYFDPNHREGWNQKGLALISLGRYDEALEAFNQCTRITTSNAEIWNNKGLAYAGLEDYPKALDAFKMAVNLDPSYAEAQANLDKAYLRKPFFSPAATQSPEIPVTLPTPQKTVLTTPSPEIAATAATSNIPIHEQTPEESLTAGKTPYAPLTPFTIIISLIIVIFSVVMTKKIKRQ